MTGLEAAREALRVRQGKGARYDAPEAPGEALALARLGTSAVARLIGGTPDAALYEPSARAGASRAHLVAALALQARLIARQVEAVTDATPPEPLPADLCAEVAYAATLPPRALRHFFDHAAIHLDVVWRDLPGAGWAAPAPGNSAPRPLSDTPMERARALWAATLMWGVGGRAADVPPALRAALTQDPVSGLPAGLSFQG